MRARSILASAALAGSALAQVTLILNAPPIGGCNPIQGTVAGLQGQPGDYKVSAEEVHLGMWTRLDRARTRLRAGSVLPPYFDQVMRYALLKICACDSRAA
jgi:hypothetical protein